MYSYLKEIITYRPGISKCMISISDAQLMNANEREKVR